MRPIPPNIKSNFPQITDSQYDALTAAVKEWDNYNKKIQAQQGQQKAFVHQAQPPNQELYSKNICVLCKEQISTRPNTWDYVVISSYKSSTTITAIETAKIYHYHRTCFSTIAGEDFFEDDQ